jgi:hypothetical protein
MSNINMEHTPYGIWSDELCTWVQVRHVASEHPDDAGGWAALCFSKDQAQVCRVGVAQAANLHPDKCHVLAIREADRPEVHTYI